LPGVGERLAHVATHYPLTDLSNRTLLLNRLGATLKRPGRMTTVLFIDLDKLKVINDSLGHDVGNKVLRIASERLHRGVANCRPKCVIICCFMIR
jgi:diguanylate cyclase (GGDEF)-like protein